MLVVICAVIFPATGLYDRNWRFASISDLMSIVNAGIFSSLTFVFALFLFNRVESIPRSVVAIEMLLLIPLLAFVRLRFRLDELRPLGPYYSGTDVRKEAVPILLVGAGHGQRRLSTVHRAIAIRQTHRVEEWWQLSRGFHLA